LSEPTYETFYEEEEIETDEEMEEVIQKEITKDVIKEVKIPQAKALYPFSGSGITINKDEVRPSVCYICIDRSSIAGLLAHVFCILVILFMYILDRVCFGQVKQGLVECEVQYLY
jgi:hypothetical protein